MDTSDTPPLSSPVPLLPPPRPVLERQEASPFPNPYSPPAMTDINVDEVFKFKDYSNADVRLNYMEHLSEDVKNYKPFSATVNDPTRNLKQGSLDWFAERAKCDVTASEFSAAAGRNYFKSRSELVQAKKVLEQN